MLSPYTQDHVLKWKFVLKDHFFVRQLTKINDFKSEHSRDCNCHYTTATVGLPTPPRVEIKAAMGLKIGMNEQSITCLTE